MQRAVGGFAADGWKRERDVTRLEGRGEAFHLERKQVHSKIFPKAEERHCTQYVCMYVSEVHSWLCLLLFPPLFRGFATIQTDECRGSTQSRRLEETPTSRTEAGLKIFTNHLSRETSPPPKSAIWRTYLGGGYTERGLVRKRTRGKM